MEWNGGGQRGGRGGHMGERGGQGGGKGGRGGKVGGGSGTVGASLEMGHLARVEGDGGRSRKKTEHFQFEAGHTLFSASTAKYQVFTC